jgi:GAF domain-containing protein/HAMP domain-containing protein
MAPTGSVKPVHRINSIQTRLLVGIGLIVSLQLVIVLIGFVSIAKLQAAVSSAGQLEELGQNLANEFILALIIITVLTLGVGGLVAYWLVRSIVPPLGELTAATSQLGQGKLTRRARIHRSDEFGILAQGLNDMADQLEALVGSLEERVLTRTRRLELMAVIGERVSSILRLDDLLDDVVNQVKERFDFYHVHIYLLNVSRQTLVVAEGTGLAGTQMKSKGHSIPLDAATSLVARAARTGQVVKIENVRDSTDWLPNPLLPDTYSEMAVPIILAEDNQVVGVLDVQQDEIAGFDETDTNMLRYLSGQVAVAIRNARLFEQSETALARAERVQQQYLEQAWQKYLSMTPLANRKYEFVKPGALAISRETELLAGQLAHGYRRPAIIPLVSNEDLDKIDENPSLSDERTTAIVAPISVHNKDIGSLQIYPMTEDQRWSDQDLALIEAVMTQFVQTAENMRLFEETRERATQERAIREITDRLRAAPNINRLLSIATTELGRYFSATHARLELGRQPPEQQDAGSRNGGGVE